MLKKIKNNKLLFYTIIPLLTIIIIISSKIMTKNELKKLLSEDNLLRVIIGGFKKYYIDGKYFVVNEQVLPAVNVFGICQIKEKYYAFITDENGELTIYFENFNDEEDACEALYDKIWELDETEF